jgi:hypothetical protein
MALSVLPIPDGLEWQDWADTVVWLNPTILNKVSPFSNWRAFADQLSMVETRVPRTDEFNSWQDWVGALRLSFGL